MRIISLDTTETKACAKCNRSDIPIYRHHKGNDGFLGWYNKAIRFHYHAWLDCVPLCSDHHCEIHYLYQPIINQWVNRTPKGAAHVRKTFIRICNRWLEGKIKSPKIPPEFLESWRIRQEQWKEATDGRGAKGSRELGERVHGVHEGE